MTRLDRDSTVCALIPHYECQEWLAGALESVLGQSRPPDAVVVVDDASRQPPLDAVGPYPEVTLLRATDNGGPYRLIQAVIDTTDFDAYLFQDADDWSAPDRLEALLDEAAHTGAELVGSHEVRVLVEEGDVVPVRYPLDVNAAMAGAPTGFPLLHPTSLVSRDLVCRVGGFATGMRFSGDAEFLRRAVHAGRVGNADHFGYFRRKRAGSLTTAAGTALTSPARRRVQAEIAAVAARNAVAVAAGRPPDLRPWSSAARPSLKQLSGPPLVGRRRPVPPARTRPPNGKPAAAPETTDGPSPGLRPVFVVGAPRSGQAFLSWALGHHRSFATVVDPRWMARVVASAAAATGDDSAAPADLVGRVAEVVAGLASPAGRRWVAAGAAVTEALPALTAAFADGRVLHLVRDPAEVVADLAARPTDGGAYHAPEGAWRAWTEGAGAGLAAEEELGAGRVLRIAHRDLVSDPEVTFAACLAFLGEEPDPAVGPALDALDPAPTRPAPPGPPDVMAEAEALARHLFEGRRAARSPDAPLAAARRPTRPRVSPTLPERLVAMVVDAVPPGAVVAVVSKGDERLLRLEGRTGWHFPRGCGGLYAGHHPADGDAAVDHLAELQRRGASRFVLPASAFWWLGHYPELRSHLEAHHRLVAFHEEVGLVYRLAGGPLGPPPPETTATTATTATTVTTATTAASGAASPPPRLGVLSVVGS